MKHAPLFFLVLFAIGAAYLATHVSLHEPLGPICELKEKFVAAGRPAYTHHCVCWGIKYNENPPPAPNAEAKRCFGLVKRSWTDVDEIAVQELAAQEAAARSAQMFDRLPPEAQRRVKTAYGKLRQAAFRRDYQFMLDQAKIILVEVDDYGETRALETVARKALEAGGRAP